MVETKMSTRKKVSILVIVLLILISFSAFFVVKWVNAETIEENLALGQKYYDQGNYEEAVIAYETVLDIDPKNVEARVGLAKSYFALNKVKKAEAVLVKGIEIIPREPSFYLELANQYLDLDEIVKAIKILDKGLTETNDGQLKKKQSKISRNIELVAEKTLLQVGQTSNLKVIYHSAKTDADSKSDGENKNSNTDKSVSVSAKWDVKNSKIGSLDKEEGDTNVFTSSAEGKETVIAAIGSIKKYANLEVQKQVLTTIQVKMNQDPILVGDNVDLSAIGIDAFGKEMTIDPNWTVVKGTGTLSTSKGPSNSFTTTEAGTTEILVSEGDVETAVNITVEEKLHTLTKIIEGKGSIYSKSEGNSYEDGEQVTLTATPSKGWIFDHWEGHVSSSHSTISFVMDGDVTVKAVFKKIPEYTIFTSTSGKGTITQLPYQSKYLSGSSVTLKAVPEHGWRFDHWEGDISGKKFEITVKMDSSKTIRAVFIKKDTTYDLATEVEGQGTIKRNVDQESYTEGSKVTLTAIPAKGWAFSHWEGDSSGKTNPMVVTMDDSKKVRAVFAKKDPQMKTYQLETTVEGQGIINKTPSYSNFDEGTNVQLSAKPKEGWLFNRWEGDLTGTTNPATIRMDSNKRVKAIFIQTGAVNGVIKNAKTGGVLSNAQVTLRKGENARTGNSAASVMTNSSGAYTINDLVPGVYTMEISANEFTTKFVSAEIVAGTSVEKNESIMPIEKELTSFSAVLTWGLNPNDLDSHLTGPIANSNERFHVYFENRLYAKDGVKYAELDVDDTDGEGPETITTFKEVDGVYRYFVQNFSKDAPLVNSGAKVELYKEGKLIRTFVIPKKGVDGEYWHVLEIDHGLLKVINQISNAPMD